MRLIDADALREWMYHGAFEVDSGMQKWDSGLWIRYKMFENGIESAPTIDAVPVVQGKWIEDGYNHYKAVCSECGEPCGTYVMNNPRDRFCKWCGAKMDGERKDGAEDG